MITTPSALGRLEIPSGLLKSKMLFVRLVTLTVSGGVAIVSRLSPGCEQCVHRNTDVAHCVVGAEE